MVKQQVFYVSRQATPLQKRNRCKELLRKCSQQFKLQCSLETPSVLHILHIILSLSRLVVCSLIIMQHCGLLSLPHMCGLGACSLQAPGQCINETQTRP
eukprot:m.299517 g.299517  ORF g.299517 m.299517 type:complete len:99 (+) comp15872_c0_seq1:1581-1877(+)